LVAAGNGGSGGVGSMGSLSADGAKDGPLSFVRSGWGEFSCVEPAAGETEVESFMAGS
jgi:hypothetical protein